MVLTFHVGALTYFNISKCSHASLHPGKVGSCKQPLILNFYRRGIFKGSYTIKVSVILVGILYSFNRIYPTSDWIRKFFHYPARYDILCTPTRLKIITCSRSIKTGCNNVVLPILFIVVNNIVQHCYT